MTNPNDSAFPFVIPLADDPNGRKEPITAWADVMFPGLSKREEFAKAAMQGILAHPNKGRTFEIMAKDALKMADALIAELNKEPKS